MLTAWGEQVVNGPAGTLANGIVAPVFALMQQLPGVAFADWAWIHSPDGITALTADGDEDGDGLDNRAEYIWGLDPLAADSWLRAGREGSGVAFRVSTDSLAAGHYLLETSGDCASWDAAALTFDPVAHQWSLDGSDGPAALAAQETDGPGWTLTFHADAAQAVFMRVRFAPDAE
jgi:hypothetical protein